MYSYYDYDYYSYNSADSPNSAECLTVNRAVNMLAQFINALAEVTRTEGNLLFGATIPIKNVRSLDLEGSNLSIFLEKVFRMVQEENVENNCVTLAESLFSIGKAAAITFFGENDNGKSFASIMEWSIALNFEYLKNIAYSMPDQDQYLVIKTLFNVAKWINQLANQYPFAQQWGADSFEEIRNYDNLWEDSDEMKKNIDADELYNTDGEEYDNHRISDFDYGALVDEIDEMDKNKEKVNLTIN